MFVLTLQRAETPSCDDAGTLAVNYGSELFGSKNEAFCGVGGGLFFLCVHFRDFLVDPESKRRGKQYYNSCLNMRKLHFISCLICAIND